MNHEHRRQWADWYFEDQEEYFFERVPRYFDPIYDFYATGKLHVPKDLCFDKFMAELRFWAVSKSRMDECCSPFAQYCMIYDKRGSEKDHFIGIRCANLRRKLWLILEGHTHSRWWKVFEVISTAFIVLSISALILGSLPEFQVPQKTEDGQLVYATATYPTYPNSGGGMTVESRTVVREGGEQQVEMTEHPVFTWVENLCVVYFSLEYLVRFLVAPRKLAFARQFLNVIDLLSIAPFYFEMLLWLCGISGENVRKVRWAFLTVRLLRVLRVIRIAKLGRFSPGLANFALTIRKSKKQMQMVGVVMITVVIFFSTLIYFLERDEPDTKFTSIPATFWWCVVTMATVGYGDLVPLTVAGKMVGSGAIVCGVMVLALPITIMVNNFMQVVKLREEKIVKKYAQQHGDHV
ncbi:K+ channel tetramerization domain protein [Ancylostoma duodenale]|uniref:K+ channel tetramerization domain protein n=1 Tax=Ancylostoma duodenale TaxID=51022 RepID=A0A0C2H5C7_9BILA|nr:K+ channel tetramerization domain protein [Ancylostoma duodenale]